MIPKLPWRVDGLFVVSYRYREHGNYDPRLVYSKMPSAIGDGAKRSKTASNCAMIGRKAAHKQGSRITAAAVAS